MSLTKEDFVFAINCDGWACDFECASAAYILHRTTDHDVHRAGLHAKLLVTVIKCQLIHRDLEADRLRLARFYRHALEGFEFLDRARDKRHALMRIELDNFVAA